MIRVDGKEYAVEVMEIGLDVEFMYKYAERTEDFGLKYELGAVYFNQSLVFGAQSSGNRDFADLFRLLSSRSTIDKGTGHRVEIWTPLGKMEFLMYPDKLSMKMLHNDPVRQETWWNSFSVNFIAVRPVERW